VRRIETKRALLKLGGKKTFVEVVEYAKHEEMIHAASGTMKLNESKNVNRVSFNNFGAQGQRGRSRTRGRNQKPHQKNQNPRSKSRGNYAKGDRSQVECLRCHKMGHIARFCYSKVNFRQNHPSTSTSANNVVENVGHLNVGKLDFINEITDVLGESNEDNRIQILELKVRNAKISFEVDTGTCFTVMSSKDFDKYFPNLKLKACDVNLKVVSGEKLQVRGKAYMDLSAHNKNFLLELYVINTNKHFMPLLGRDWLNVLCPRWRDAFLINALRENFDWDETKVNGFRTKTVNEIKSNYACLFDNDLSMPISDMKVDIRMRNGVKGFVHKPYNVPHSIKDKVESEIDKMIRDKIIKRVEYVEWASPMVAVKKSNGEIRCCLDGSKTINPFIETNHYPIPLIDDLLANKSDANWFSVLDLKGAYTQLCVSDQTQQMLGLSTIKGLFVYQRLPFGVKPAASIFQSAMDKILEGLENVQAYIDDVLMWGKLHKIFQKQ
jgi:hypothetical protein